MPVPVTVRAVDRVLVVLRPAPPGPASVRPGPATASIDLTGRRIDPTDQRLVTAGEVLASWFGASLQLVTTGDGAAERLEALAGTIGLRTDPVLMLPDTAFENRLDRHAAEHAPALLVAVDSDAARRLARGATQPTLLVPPGPPRRQPSGPLLVDLVPGEASDDALALATVWALALDTPLALIVDDSPQVAVAAERVTLRLRTMGVTVEPALSLPAALARFALPDAPLALVVPAAALDRSPAAQATRSAGGTLLVAPPPRPERRAPSVDLSAVGDLSAALGETADEADELSPTECIEILCSASVGRIGYVDHGWPVVVPVSYSVDPERGDVFIRSLRGGKLAAAARRDRVCFEVDTGSASTPGRVPGRSGAAGHGGAGASARSVVVHGHLEVISDPATLQAAWATEPAPGADSDQRVWLRLITLATTGRRIG